MRYLFAYKDIATCERLSCELAVEGIACEVRHACEFPEGTQGPELWVSDADHDNAKDLVSLLERES